MIEKLWADQLSTSATVRADAKTALQEWAQGRGLPLPVYLDIDRRGPDHKPEFTTEVQIQGMAPARAVGDSKRASQQAAAREILVREHVWDSEAVDD